MFYDDLLRLKEQLERALDLVSHDRLKTVKQRNQEKQEIIRRLILIENKLKDILQSNLRYQKIYDVSEARVFKKEVKHEFLVQVSDGYSLRDILMFIHLNMDNPGINVDKFVDQLRYDEKTGRGYFTMDKDGSLVLLPHAWRFLENVANVSLKR